MEDGRTTIDPPPLSCRRSSPGFGAVVSAGWRRSQPPRASHRAPPATPPRGDGRVARGSRRRRGQALACVVWGDRLEIEEVRDQLQHTPGRSEVFFDGGSECLGGARHGLATVPSPAREVKSRHDDEAKERRWPDVARSSVCEAKDREEADGSRRGVCTTAPVWGQGARTRGAVCGWQVVAGACLTEAPGSAARRRGRSGRRCAARGPPRRAGPPPPRA